MKRATPPALAAITLVALSLSACTGPYYEVNTLLRDEVERAANRLSELVDARGLRGAELDVTENAGTVGASPLYDEKGEPEPALLGDADTVLVDTDLADGTLQLTMYIARSAEDGGGWSYERSSAYICVLFVADAHAEVSLENSECNDDVLTNLSSSVEERTLFELGL